MESYDDEESGEEDSDAEDMARIKSKTYDSD